MAGMLYFLNSFMAVENTSLPTGIATKGILPMENAVGKESCFITLADTAKALGEMIVSLEG